MNRRFAITTYAFGLLIATYSNIFMQRSVWKWSTLVGGLICMGVGIASNWYQRRGQPPTAQTWWRRALTWLFFGAALITLTRDSHIANGLFFAFVFVSIGIGEI